MATKKDFAKKRAEIRAFLDLLRRGPCEDCDQFFDPCAMEFDHCRGKKVIEISAIATIPKSWKTLFKELKKCDLVCANCHRVRGCHRKSGHVH